MILWIVPLITAVASIGQQYAQAEGQKKAQAAAERQQVLDLQAEAARTEELKKLAGPATMVAGALGLLYLVFRLFRKRGSSG